MLGGASGILGGCRVSMVGHPHMLTLPTSKVMPIDFTLSKIIGRGRVIRLAASFNTGDSYLRNSLKHKYVPIFLYSLLAPTMAA